MNNYCTLYNNSFECKIFSKCEISLATNNAQINSQSGFVIVVIIPLAGLLYLTLDFRVNYNFSISQHFLLQKLFFCLDFIYVQHFLVPRS